MKTYSNRWIITKQKKYWLRRIFLAGLGITARTKCVINSNQFEILRQGAIFFHLVNIYSYFYENRYQPPEDPKPMYLILQIYDSN